MAGGAIVIDRRYRGFEQIAQGGYTSGLLAGFIDGPARVRLRGAVPMERPLRVEEARLCLRNRHSQGPIEIGVCLGGLREDLWAVPAGWLPTLRSSPKPANPWQSLARRP